MLSRTHTATSTLWLAGKMQKNVVFAMACGINKKLKQ
jgi:hypothetical protein